MGWLVAIAYLLGCFTPAMAAPILTGPAAVTPAAHESMNCHPDASEQAALAAAADSQDAPAEHDQPAKQHGTCCSSGLCFSGVSPQSPSLVHLAAPRSRCAVKPELQRADTAPRRLYRPPIA